MELRTNEQAAKVNLPMLYQPFGLFVRLNARIFDNEIKTECLIRRDDDL